MAATGDLFAPDIQARLQTFRVRWTQGECCALIQEAPWQMDNDIVYAGLVATRDGARLLVRCDSSSSSMGLAFNMFALVLVN